MRKPVFTAVFIMCLSFNTVLGTVVTLDTDFGGFYLHATATPLGENSWLFEYDVTNTQSVHVIYGFFDGFFIQVPSVATPTNVTVPEPYGGQPGYWTFGETAPAGWPGAGLVDMMVPDYDLYVWWGQTPGSTYPPGATAHCSFEVDNVSVGQTPAVLANYISGVATTYTFPYDILAPVFIPEPVTLSLLVTGGVVMLKRRWR